MWDHKSQNFETIGPNSILLLKYLKKLIIFNKHYTLISSFTTKREIEKLLKEAGFEKRTGGRHDIWLKNGYPPIPVPRHKGDIPIGTAKNILKAAGLEN